MAFLDMTGLSCFKDKIMEEIGKVVPVEVSFSIATSDWTLSNGVYTATISDSSFSANTKDVVFLDDSAKNNLIGDMVIDKDSSTYNLIVKVDYLPANTISGYVLVFDSTLQGSRGVGF